MGKYIRQKNFEVKCKEDLYNTILVKVGQDYHECCQYDHHTPFGLCKNLDEFTGYLNMLSEDEIIDYRDDYDGCILHDMVTCSLPKIYFDEVRDRIGNYHFVKLLEVKDRGNTYAIANISDLSLFKYLISFSGMNGDMIQQISCRCPMSILKYLAKLINNSLFDGD